MKNKILHLAYELCSIPSSTYEENNILIYLEDYFLRAGLNFERLKLAGQKNRYNILVYKNKKSFYNTIFCTHLDTVRPYIPPRIDQDILWGRGSCDAKGIAACMIMTLHAQISKGFEDLALLLTVGEEESSDGAKSANEHLRGMARFLVVGEPTMLKAASAQKGSLVFDLNAHGQEAHSALPHLGESAITKLVDSIYNINNYSWPKNNNYGETLVNFGILEGGQARNMLAKQARAHGIMRIVCESEYIIKILSSKLSAGISLDIKSICEPFLYTVPPGFESFVAGFGSDAPYLCDVGQPLLIGPGDLALAHKENEHISAQELLSGFKAYEKIADFSRS